ncbi:TlyA family RNA methyltransferase [Methylocella tundrae]|uniref:16S/23S rRNA (Cytidine-2'-O)-methyltransferase TlyA n=1 Tax=Methylocella tundrae TaxID=227605 RepID=A0A4V6IMG4_METTU|nr:TlyA family RNA methyltransferase [Methylocella tundrae]WPP05604.1 TlyA family RNA methyltransferase [Methylocella tundrae]VFU08057.1 16S/23S rRNA (cytidine-2'-O)-methyltransferase TlyA [Methylocella tundrae]
MKQKPKSGATAGARPRADVALVERKLFDSRAKAQEAIAAGRVSVDGKTLRKASEPVDAGAHVEASAPYPWVSRGGVKLAAALDAFRFDPSGLACLDVGASTGGFTHVLLTRGAAHVFAVDVGRGQLRAEIARDPRVESREATDVRSLEANALPRLPRLVAIDVSFISLALVLPAVARLAAADAKLIALIKPQFEAGRAHLVKGLVKDRAVHEEVCARIKDLVQSLGWRVEGLIPSPIEGGDGNREFLIGASRR